MSFSVLWIDRDSAKLFDFLPEGEKVTQLQNAHHHNHHTNHQDQEKREQQKKFFAEVSLLVTNPGKVLVVGPSKAKMEFKKYVEDHNQRLDQAIIGLETMDQMTDGQIRDFAKKYFHKYNLFN